MSLWLQSEEFEGAQAAGAVPAEFAPGAGVVCVPGAVQDADDEVVHGGQEAGQCHGLERSRMTGVSGAGGGARLPVVTVRDVSTGAVPDLAAVAGEAGSAVCRFDVKWRYLAWRDR